MKARTARHGLILFAAWSLLAWAGLRGSDARAQTVDLGGARLATGFRSWTMHPDSGRSRTVTQFYLPVDATVRLGHNSDLVVRSEGAWANYGLGDQETASLNGTSDVGIQAIRRFPSRRLFLLGGVNIPVGKKEMSRAELDVARALGNPLLGFHLKEYGQGLNLNLGATASLPVAGLWSLGVGFGYLYRGPYVLSAGGERFRPTPEGTASVGLQIAGAELGDAVGSSEWFAVYRVLGKDKLGSRTVLDEGDELLLQAQGDIRWPGLRSYALARLLRKDDNRAFAGSGSQVVTEDRSAGTGILARFGVETRFSAGFRARVNGEWYHFGGSENAIDNGDTYGLGPALRFVAGADVQFDLAFLYLVGDLKEVEGAGDIRLRGYAVSLMIVQVPTP